MNVIYPAGPAQVPEGFTRPSGTYMRHAWMAVGALLLFMALYFALAAWFVYNGIAELGRAAGDGGFLAALVGVGSLFLAFFLIKALFFIKKGAQNDGIELTRADQPSLFAFLDRIADEAGAPRPHKVYASGRVNAAVSYDLSLLNLLFPSRKNLEIGLGLVNMLNLGEFKAVCAHEFGHFGQRSMAVGRWVYTAQQVAAHIVTRRDALDSFLRGLSRLDIRIAWIGWLLGIVIWALRVIVDAGFRLVVLAQRALAREMELQADLVAVSLTGSDALVHALHRLRMADDAWDRSLNFLRGEVGAKRPPRDIFAVQEALADRLGLIYNDPGYARRPQLPAEGGAAFRVFESELAQPPRMWSTHPMNHERESNAKRTYLFAPADERSAWSIFEHEQGLRERMTHELAGKPAEPTVELDETLKRLDEQFAREHLKPDYRGIYLGMSAVRHASSPGELYYENAVPRLPLSLEDLYPQRIGEELDRLQALDREHALLCSLRDRVYDAPDGVIRHRGRILKRSQLPAVIAEVEKEHTGVRASLHSTLRRVRSLHLKVAATLAPAWRDYLLGSLHVLHYADHAEANLRDAQAALAKDYRQAAARGSINENGVRRILAGASDVHRAISRIFNEAATVKPGARILARLGASSWPQALGNYGLRAPERANINEWLRHIDGWINHTANWLSALRRTTLDELLAVEASIAAATRDAALGEAPADMPSAHDEYPTLVPGSERGQQIKQGFRQRFESVGDRISGVGKASAALAIVGSVLAFGWLHESTDVTVYNPLDRAVVAKVDGHRVNLQPHQHADISLRGEGQVEVDAQTDDGEPIEHFSAPVDRSDDKIIYTVAAAAPLHSWMASYGSAPRTTASLLSPQRWQVVHADFVFTQPPHSIQTNSGQGVRTVLDGLDAAPPEFYADQVHDQRAVAQMMLAHVRFDKPDSINLWSWLELARSMPGFDQAFAERRKHFPFDVLAMRLEQDHAIGATYEEICARDQSLAQASPEQPDLAYAATRCLAPGPAQDRKFAEGAQRWPHSPWFAMASAFAEAQQQHYPQALELYTRATNQSLALRNSIATEVVRLSRLVDPAGTMQRQSQLAAVSPALANLLLLEPGSAMQDDPQYRALSLLSDGRLDNALTTSAHTPMEGHVLRMVAASQGASAVLRARAAALPKGVGVDQETVWLALAQGGDANDPAVAKVLERLEAGYGREGHAWMESMQRFVEFARRGDAANAERALTGVPMEMRAQAYVAGIYLLGPMAPDAWRHFARAILFAGERPFLG
ncbi:M48 family metallopeptidase [Dyella choica]|uniref:Zn-dependent protease with chaperone function n=1 Tax=Dyella choica TaxID=1927959 RepID=A0A3S0WSE8_9GAMM|nr:M48 family metallopeptidase [Dyella choica]RUL69084.1 Zn-dependent protease with chaperone function [Dyella choica]